MKYWIQMDQTTGKVVKFGECMTNKEKFYQLCLNILNDEDKTLIYRAGKLKTITTIQGRNEITIYLSKPRKLDFYLFVKDETVVCVYEDDPSNIDELIKYLRKYHFRSNLLEGIE